MCFIDDDISRNTLDVIKALSDYGEKMNISMECELLAVAIDWEGIDEDTYEYYKKKYEEKNIYLMRCDTEECLRQKIEERLQCEVCFMLDLHLRKNEEDNLNDQLDYECLSMRVLDWINGEIYHIYSLFTEDPYKDKWCKQFNKLYRRDIPNIIERERLKPGSFSKTIANEILGRVMMYEKENI